MLKHSQRAILVGLCAAAALGLGSCGEDNSGKSTATKAQEAAANVAGEAKDIANKAKDSAVARATDLCNAAKMKIDELSKKFDGLPDSSKAPLKPSMDSIKAQWGEVQQKFGELKGAAADKWSAISADLTEKMGKLNSSVSDLASKMK